MSREGEHSPFTCTIQENGPMQKYFNRQLTPKQPRSQGLFPGFGAGAPKPGKRPWERG